MPCLLAVQGVCLLLEVHLDATTLLVVSIWEGTLPAALGDGNRQPQSQQVSAGRGRCEVLVGRAGVEDVGCC